MSPKAPRLTGRPALLELLQGRLTHVERLPGVWRKKAVIGGVGLEKCRSRRRISRAFVLVPARRSWFSNRERIFGVVHTVIKSRLPYSESEHCTFSISSRRRQQPFRHRSTAPAGKVRLYTVHRGIDTTTTPQHNHRRCCLQQIVRS